MFVGNDSCLSLLNSPLNSIFVQYLTKSRKNIRVFCFSQVNTEHYSASKTLG